jgi:hypothetical protein
MAYPAEMVAIVSEAELRELRPNSANWSTTARTTPAGSTADPVQPA